MRALAPESHRRIRAANGAAAGAGGESLVFFGSQDYNMECSFTYPKSERRKSYQLSRRSDRQSEVTP
jgi:hypothetical protein